MALKSFSLQTNLLTSFARSRLIAALLQLSLETQVNDAVSVDDAEENPIAQEGADHHDVGSSTAIGRLMMLHFCVTWLLNFRRYNHRMIGRVICQKRFSHRGVCVRVCLGLCRRDV